MLPHPGRGGPFCYRFGKDFPYKFSTICDQFGKDFPYKFLELLEKSEFSVLLGFYLSFDQTSKKYNKGVVSSGAIYIFDLAENDLKEIVRCNMDRKILATTTIHCSEIGQIFDQIYSNFRL